MNLFFHPNSSKRFGNDTDHAILSQILREPLPATPITLDFTYLSVRDEHLRSQNAAFYHQEICQFNSNFSSSSSSSSSSMDVIYMSSSHVHSEPHSKTKSDSLHEMQRVESQQHLEETTSANAETNTTFTDCSTDNFLNALYYINKNLTLEPASEFDNWFPMYSDMPLFE